jgi:4-amino-4-deoxy-L-arabinose transferase-like glycosyltransferase
VIGALAAAAVTALALAGFAAVAGGLWRPDAFDYAQIGRELAEGRGFSSRQAIYALHLAFLRDHGLLFADWPNLHRFPLPSLLMAAGFRLFGTSDAVVMGTSIACQAATAGLLFAFARAALGLAPAVACVFLVCANGVLLETGASGLSEPPATFCFTLAVYAVWRQRAVESVWPGLLAGAALGFAALARTNLVFAAPLFLAALALARRGPQGQRDLRRGGAAAALAALAMAAVASPWWLRNAWWTGDPFFSLHSYFLIPSGAGEGADKWDLTLPWVRELHSPLAYLAEHPGAVFEKWWGHFARLLRELPTFAGTRGVMPVAAAALLLPAGPGLRPVAWLLVAAFALNALIVSLGDFYLIKYHLHVLPGMILLAVGVAWQQLQRLTLGGPRLRALLLACVALALADLVGVAQELRRVPLAVARFEPAHWDAIRKETAEDAVIVSDQSYAVTWRTGRRSVRVHYDRLPDGSPVLGVLALSDAYLPIDAVHLSREFLSDPAHIAILAQTFVRVPRFGEEFPRVRALEGGGLLLLRPITPRIPAAGAGRASPDRPALPPVAPPPPGAAPPGAPR